MEENIMGVPQYREKIQEVLNICYSKDLIEVEELEKRLTLAQQASTMEDLNLLIADAPSQVLNTVDGLQLADTSALYAFSRDERTSFCILSSRTIKKSNLQVQRPGSITILGETTIDFRGMKLPQEKIILDVTNVLGSTKILVDPGTPIDFEVVTILGDSTEKGDLSPLNGKGPGITIRGICLLGDVVVVAKKGFLEKLVEKL